MTAELRTSTLSEVVSRFSKLSSPDRRLDASIAQLINDEPNFAGIKWVNGEPYYIYTGRAQTAPNRVWKYTASVDSAIRVLPRGWYLEEVYRPTPNGEYEITVRRGGLAITTKSATLSIAVCHAAMKARVAEGAGI